MEIKEKQTKIVKEDENNQDKKTDTPDSNEDKKELEHNKKEFPFINIRKISTLSDCCKSNQLKLYAEYIKRDIDITK